MQIATSQNSNYLSHSQAPTNSGMFFLQSKQRNELDGNPGIVINDREAIDEEENFEEINESREIIEERINKIKLHMIDYTVKQQEISDKSLNLTKDNELLLLKLEDTVNLQ